MTKIDRGIAAEHLLKNELFQEVMRELDGAYHYAWRNAKTLEAREDLHRYVHVRDQIIKDIQTIATTGKLEEERQKQLEGQVVRLPMNEWKQRTF